MRLRFPLPRVSAAAVAAAVVLLAAPSAALAQCPQTSLGEIEDEVMCPVCGTPLALATEAPQAQEEREFIVERIERCESKDEIKAALVGEFGEGVLATPGDDGFDLAAYAVPGGAMLAGAVAIALGTVRWRRGRAAGAAGDANTHDAPATGDAARLEADLERYDL